MNAFNGKCHFTGSSSSGTPVPIFKMICTVDYVGDPTLHANIWISRFKGGVLAHVIVSRLFFSFMLVATGLSFGPIITV